MCTLHNETTRLVSRHGLCFNGGRGGQGAPRDPQRRITLLYLLKGTFESDQRTRVLRSPTPPRHRWHRFRSSLLFWEEIIPSPFSSLDAKRRRGTVENVWRGESDVVLKSDQRKLSQTCFCSGCDPQPGVPSSSDAFISIVWAGPRPLTLGVVGPLF